MSENAFNKPLDAPCLARLQARCRQTQERVYRMFVDPAWNLAIRLTGCDASAWDAVQEAFVQAFRQVRQLRDETAFGFWLRRIVVNQVMNGHRLRSRESGQMPTDRSGGSPDPAWLDLEQALAALDPHDRMVLWLHDAEGMTHEEIASLAGKTVSWSKTRLSRTRARMRQTLDRETEPTPRLIRL
ncbi:MAG: sigma-70 family RNA polymerase sigma factor [Wenzhouxiangellaceae bacterium]